jgi:hypothetical protein
MSDKADADELARRYLDLWQDQMSALAADQDFARALQKLMTGMGLAGAAASAPWTAWPTMMAGLAPAPQGDATADAHTRRDSEQAPGSRRAAPGAAAAGSAPGGRDADLGELARRLAALEKRLAALEGGARPGRGGPARKPRKGRA